MGAQIVLSVYSNKMFAANSYSENECCTDIKVKFWLCFYFSFLFVCVCFEYSLSRLIFSVNLDGKHKKGNVRTDADAHVLNSCAHRREKAASFARGGGGTLAFISLP